MLIFLKYHLEHALTFISFAVVDPVLLFCCARSSLERDAAALAPQYREPEGDGDNWCFQNGASVVLSQPQAERRRLARLFGRTARFVYRNIRH